MLNIEDHLGLAFDYVLKYCKVKGSVKDSEEYSDALLGLTQALDTFKHSKGTQFSTYATACIRNAVWQGLRERGRFPEVRGDEIEILDEDTARLFEDNEALSWILGVELEKSYEQLDRQMLLEYYLERLSMKMVGERHGVTRGRVNQRITRAIAKLKSKARKRHAGCRLQPS